MLEGETVLSGAPITCIECKTMLRFEVCMSQAGYYIGTWCKCGPYSRESSYFNTRLEAQEMLDNFSPKVWGRKNQE